MYCEIVYLISEQHDRKSFGVRSAEALVKQRRCVLGSCALTSQLLQCIKRKQIYYIIIYCC